MSALHEMRTVACETLALRDPLAKCVAVVELWQATLNREIDLAPELSLMPPDEPGRPPTPELVHPARVPRRRLGTAAGRVALFHALAHIEFNAINLALDAIARFARLPADYYRDWLRVAAEEAAHFQLLCNHLRTQGAAYGDFPAHHGLWEAAFKSRHDPLVRMGLVPRILEARGLDVTPGLQVRLEAIGEQPGAAILSIILRDEVGHVAIGNRWFEYLCRERALDPPVTFRALCAEYGVKLPQPPFNRAARLAAGFGAAELTALEAAAQK